MKLVLLFNTRNRNYTLIEHNLEDRDAHLKTNTLRKYGLPSFTHDQPTLHEGMVEKCKECQRLVQSTMEKGGKP